MNTMNIEEFERRLDRFGSDVESWPITERRAALELLEREELARGLLDQAMQIETAIPRALSVPEPKGLKRRIMDEIQAGQKPAWLDLVFKSLWRPVALAMVPVSVGFVAGATTQESYADLDVELVLETFSDYEQIEDDLR